MQIKTRTEELLQRLSTSAVPVEDADRADERRARVVARLAELATELPAERRRVRRTRWATGLASAAGLVLISGYAASRRAVVASHSIDAPGSIVALGGTVQIFHQTSDVLAQTNERVAVNGTDEIVTGVDAHARASLESGAEVDIDPESRVRLVRKGEPIANGGEVAVRNEAIALARGRVEVRVPKLGPARAFFVETPEATVVVHGTKFSVERCSEIAGAGPHTSVAVTEGSVAVRHDGVEVLLRAGDRWSSVQSTDAPAQHALPTPASGATETSPTKMHSAMPAGSRVNTASSSRVPPEDSPASHPNGSSLAVENRLLQSAMSARQKGNPRRAAALAAEFITRFPRSPLVEEARVERLRALFAQGGTSAAESEARAYLVDFPNGFAQKEAHRILGHSALSEK